MTGGEHSNLRPLARTPPISRKSGEIQILSDPHPRLHPACPREASKSPYFHHLRTRIQTAVQDRQGARRRGLLAVLARIRPGLPGLPLLRGLELRVRARSARQQPLRGQHHRRVLVRRRLSLRREGSLRKDVFWGAVVADADCDPSCRLGARWRDLRASGWLIERCHRCRDSIDPLPAASTNLRDGTRAVART